MVLLSLVVVSAVQAQSGSLDTTFGPGSGVDSQVYSSALQAKGSVVIVGDFTFFNDRQRTNVARLNNNVLVDTISEKNYALEFKSSLQDNEWTALPSVAGDGTVKTLRDMSANGPQRFYRVQIQ
jgi:hypothetical protein